MSNVINYNPYTFDDSSIFSGKLALANALMFDSLNPDELTVEVMSDAVGNRKLFTVEMEWYHTVDNRGYVVANGDIRKFTYGDPVYYYHDGVLVGKFYIRSVDRLSIDRFQLSAISAAGIWASIQHYGGIYTGETVETVVADLLSGFTYTIADDVKSVPLYGWLPIASVRDNLQQVLFAVGASLMKDANGDPYIRYLDDTDPIPIGGDRIFVGAKLSYKTPATEVLITEHSFYESSLDKEVSLFDNTDGSGSATNKLVTFDSPCHTLSVTGTLTIGSSGANYAYVTGTGTLTGEQYTHTTKTFSVPTGVAGEPRSAKVEKATLVSAVNSANVAARVSEYESTAEEVSCGIVMTGDGIKPASLISFTDPYGEETEGFISTMDITMSAKSKADCIVVKGYRPTHQGNNYENVSLITTSGTWTVPEGVERIRLVLGQGGSAGQNGEDGHYGSAGFDPTVVGGQGGEAGNGGSAGKVYVVDIDSPTNLTISIGEGGTPASGELAYGNDGGETTATMGGTTYSSADGAVFPTGYHDILMGLDLSLRGITGIQGARGGNGSSAVGRDGEDLTYDGQTWHGGVGGYGHWNKWGDWGGGGGGGAAYGNDGEDGHRGRSGTSGSGGDGWTPNRAGAGGDGADAIPLPITSYYGCGGAGGNGGGGGGGGGYWSDVDDDAGSGIASGGSGGNHSNGCTGGSGYALIYY